MSLFPCRVCGRPLSTTAEKCPGCGEKFPNAQKHRRHLLVRYIIPGLLLLGGVLYWWIVLLPALKAQFLDH
jgi:predicted nucleic acid-binding Zn ribbon protein